MSSSQSERDPFAATEAGTLGDDASDAADREPVRVEDEATDPDRIGRFTVTKRLGAGAMGVVYAGHDEVLGRKVAIKLISPDRSASTEARDRMLREAQALAKLSHPNVVPVYEAGTHDGQIFVAMEYVEGRTLRQYTESSPGWRAIVAAYIQAGRGLCAAHDAGLVHRDFKPDNAMLGDDGRVRVLDFGVVASGGGAIDPTKHDTFDDEPDVVRLTRTGAIMGTPAYMAPEQYRNHPLDARADQFAFCVALHEAVYGVRPHNADNIAALAFAVIEGKIDPPPRRDPRWLYRLLRRGLQTDPGQRFSDLHALLRELEDGLGRRRRAWIVGGLIGAASALVGGSQWIFGSDPATPEVDPAPALAPTDRPKPMPTIRQVTRVSEDVQITNISLSPDGKTIAYLSTHPAGDQLAIVPADGGPGRGAPRGSFTAQDGTVRFVTKDELLVVQSNGRDASSLVSVTLPDLTARVRGTIAGLQASRITPLAISPDTSKVTVFDVPERSLYNVDEDGRIDRIAGDTFTFAFAWSPDSTRIAWIDTRSGRQPRLLLATVDAPEPRVVLSDARLGDQALTFAGNDHLVFALCEGQAGLRVAQLWERRLDEHRLDFAAEAVPITELEPGIPHDVTATPDGRSIAFVRREQRENVWVADVVGDGALASPRRSTSDVSDEFLAGWTADGHRLLFTSERDGQLALYEREIDREEEPRRLAPVPPVAELLKVEDEAFLFLQRRDDRGPPTSMVRVETGQPPTQLGDLGDIAIDCAASCAGAVCTTKYRDGDDVVVWELGSSGTRTRELARVRVSPRSRSCWALAPDGARGALVVDNSVHVLDLSGGERREITMPAPEANRAPLLQDATWAPDGGSIVVTGMFIGAARYAIVRVELDGTHEILHSEANRWLRRPRFSPDGRHLAFQAWDHEGQIWIVER